MREIDGLGLLRESGDLATDVLVALLEGLERGGGGALEAEGGGDVGPFDLEGGGALGGMLADGRGRTGCWRRRRG